MKGCFLLIVGAIVGIVLLAVAETFVVIPAPLPVASASHADLVILFRNEFLTRNLKAQLLQIGGGTTFDRVVVRGGSDQTLTLVGTAATRSVSISVPIRVVLRPTVLNNQVNFQIVKAELGNLSLPGQLFSQLQGPINDQINRSVGSSAFRIVSLSTTADGLVVEVIVTG